MTTSKQTIRPLFLRGVDSSADLNASVKSLVRCFPLQNNQIAIEKTIGNPRIEAYPRMSLDFGYPARMVRLTIPSFSAAWSSPGKWRSNDTKR